MANAAMSARTMNTVPTSEALASTTGRTITYQLPDGSVLSSVCADWCTKDHTEDLERGFHPVDLFHESDEVSLTFNLFGGDADTILAASIRVYPFSADDGTNVPYIVFTPSRSTGELVTCPTPPEFNAEIARVEKHLGALRAMSNTLALLQPGRTWRDLSRNDLNHLPIPHLLTALGIDRIIEVDGAELEMYSADLVEVDGLQVIRIDRAEAQTVREGLVRDLLIERVNHLAGGAK